MTVRVLSEEQIHEIERICNQVRRGTVMTHVPSNVIDDLITTIRDKEAQIGACERMTQRWREQAWDFEHMNKILNEELEKRDATISEYKSYGDDWRKSHDDLFTKYKILFNALERIRKMPGNSSVDLEFLGPEFLRIAREAIAKVGESR